MGMLTVRHHEVGADAGVLELSGELDLAGVEEADTGLRAAESTGPLLLVVDLRGLGFLDSSGIDCLLRAWNRAVEHRRRLVVVTSPDGVVQRVLELVGLDGHLEVRHDVVGILADTDTKASSPAA